MKFYSYLFLALTLNVGACSTLQAIRVATKPVGPSITEIRNGVLAAKSAYEALLVLAVSYNNLPRCGYPTSPKLCSDTAIVADIRKADAVASAQLDAAEATVRATNADTTVAGAALTLAQQAVSAYKNSVAAAGFSTSGISVGG